MKTHAFLAVLMGVLLTCGAFCWADGPTASAQGKLFGLTVMTGPEAGIRGPSMDVIYPLYESSRANVAFVEVDWEDCEPNDPGSAPSKYDFSRFDSQPFTKSAKTKICVIDLANPWADKTAPDYWQRAESFVTALAKHANSLGIKHFQALKYEFDAVDSPQWGMLYVESLKHIYKALKAASQDNIVIAGNLTHGADAVVQSFYDAGAKGNFDVLGIHAYSNDPKTGVDIFQVVAAHRAMVKNGDGGKKIFITEGWGPMRELPNIPRASHEQPPSEAEIEALRAFVENGYRNILTERDIYDPSWVLGASFFAMNDYYDQNQNFHNVGLVDFDGKQKDKLLDNFPPKIPKHTFEGKIVTSGPTFNYVAEQPYNLELTITNLTDQEMGPDDLYVTSHGLTGPAVTVTSNAWALGPVEPGGSASTALQIEFPKEAAGKQVTLIGELNYTLGGEKHFTDCWTTIVPTHQLELTLLPARPVLDPREESKRVGMSVINHSDQPFEGQIKLTASPLIHVEPASVEAKIDPYGLEAFVFAVTADKKAAPGHYAVFVDVGGKVTDWAAVEIPVLAKNPAGPIKIDGKLDDWTGAAAIAIARPTGDNAYDFVGKGKFCYDDANFYAAFEIDDDKHVQDGGIWGLRRQDSVQIAFDALMDGARVQSGGYRQDDYEYAFAGANSRPIAVRYQGPDDKPTGEAKNVRLAFRNESGKSFYEIAFPWDELAPFQPGDDEMFALSVVVNDSDGAAPTCVEWGGGIAGHVDPRKFIPLILTQ